MNRIDKRFSFLKKNKKKAFVAFITAGYPSLTVTERLVLEFDRRGVDIVELGVPFSDPMADGAVIQEASQAALKKKVNLKAILRLVKALRKKTDIPLCLMTYYNPVFCFGEDKFLKEASACGVDGVIIPDLPPEEGKNLLKLAVRYGINVISFISPTTSPERIKYIASVSRGFIYYVSLTGVTGARRSLSPGLIRKLKYIKSVTKKPVCAGFGVSNAAQVRQIQAVADGTIVGSAIVKKIKENLSNRGLVKRTGEFVSLLKGSRV